MDIMDANLEEDKEQELALAEVRLCIAAADNPQTPPVTLPATSLHEQEQAKGRYVLHRVPWWVREVSEHAYAPKFICIGPYHSGGETGHRLRRVELKQRYASELLKDAGADDEARRYLKLAQICKTREMEDDIRMFYGESTKGVATDDLAEMMFLDGCFIIKHLYNYALGSDPDKELYQSTWAPAQLRTDLCLLENQIPFAVLVALFEDLAPQKLRLGDADKTKKRGTLVDMALWYMLNNGWWIVPDRKRRPRPTTDLQMAADMPVDHLLHLLHEALCAMHRVAQDPRRREKDDDGGEPNALESRNIPSASELKAMGIRIKLNEPGRGGLLDMRFRKNYVSVTATLEIPLLFVERTTAPLLQNLIAYEQQQVGTDGSSKEKVGTDGSNYPDDYFTTYAFLMYNLVSTREDIALLRELGILHITFGSDDKIIEYFKNLCMFNRRRGSRLNNVVRDLSKCKLHKVYRDWAVTKKYMNSPLNVLLVIISAMVSLSTVLQALVAVRPAQH